MTANFSFGHSNLFWHYLFRTLDEVDEIPIEDRKVTLISPWFRDIPLSSSNLPTEDLRDLLDGYSGTLSKLSDVLIAMKYQHEFTVNIITLDSRDVLLPKSERSWLDLEFTMMNKLIGNDRVNPIIPVLKQLGTHAKMYIFPIASLTGSLNSTYAGLFLNGENLTLTVKDKNPEIYRQICINGQAKLDGAVPYFDESREYSRPNIIPNEPLFDHPLSDNDQPETSNFADPKQNPEAYIIPPGIRLGDIPNNGPSKLSTDEKFELHKWTSLFEEQLRSIILQYYQDFSNRMHSWQTPYFKYSKSMRFMVGEKINHLPEIGKSIPTKWSIEPELPGGINFNLETGRISGAPTQVLEESTHYTVTGSNQFGKGSYTFMLNIVRTDSKESSNQDQELPSVNLGYSSVEDYLSNKLRKEWHKFLIIKQNGDSLEESARKVLNKSSWEESDFDDGDMPDFENLSPYDSITYGTYLIDLWTCLYGSKDDPFNDYSGSKLLDKSLYFFTTQVLGLSARRDEEKVKKFWYKLEDDFYSIYWVRNHNAHTHPIPRARAIACQTALIKFEKLVLKPFADYISQR
jgi:hypothetical protein